MGEAETASRTSQANIGSDTDIAARINTAPVSDIVPKINAAPDSDIAPTNGTARDVKAAPHSRTRDTSSSLRLVLLGVICRRRELRLQFWTGLNDYGVEYPIVPQFEARPSSMLRLPSGIRHVGFELRLGLQRRMVGIDNLVLALRVALRLGQYSDGTRDLQRADRHDLEFRLG
jgi:hypothetical protein